jgi:tRNA U38,U39,U40 pseudouridine synthase TruA
MPTFLLRKNGTVPFDIIDQKDTNGSVLRSEIIAKQADCLSAYKYRIPEGQKSFLQKILSQFKGVKKFHNYTKVVKHLWYSHKFFLKKNIKKIKTMFENDTSVEDMMSEGGFGNSSAILRKWSHFKFYSTINESSVIDYPIVDGIEFARIKILGRSFFKYQVRRMMGAVHKVMKDGLSEDFIKQTLGISPLIFRIRFTYCAADSSSRRVDPKKGDLRLGV